MSQTFLDAPLGEVTGPAGQPAGFGLYSVAPPIDATLRYGVRFLDEVASTASSFPIDCPPTWELATDGPPSWVEAPVFGVSAGLGVDHILGLGVDELRKLARTRLALQESAAVESVYWTGKTAGGDDAGVPSLAGTAETLSASAVSLAVGLGLLEEWIGAHTGALGVIHAARHTVGTLLAAGVHRDGARLRTLVDTPVAVGTGYPGTGPAGTRTAGTSWLYATGPVQVMRDGVLDLPTDPRVAVDRAVGAVAIHAVRYVSVAHTVGAAAVPITLP